MTAAVIDAPRLRRLVPCPVCADRRRTLVETDGALSGNCLGCGGPLPSPLAVEAVTVVPTPAPRRLSSSARVA